MTASHDFKQKVHARTEITHESYSAAAFAIKNADTCSFRFGPNESDHWDSKTTYTRIENTALAPIVRDLITSGIGVLLENDISDAEMVKYLAQMIRDRWASNTPMGGARHLFYIADDIDQFMELPNTHPEIAEDFDIVTRGGRVTKVHILGFVKESVVEESVA